MHKPSRATDPLISVGYKHSAEGAGGEPNPSWLPLPKTRMGGNPLQFWERKNKRFLSASFGWATESLPRRLIAQGLLAQKGLDYKEHIGGAFG